MNALSGIFNKMPAALTIKLIIAIVVLGALSAAFFRFTSASSGAPIESPIPGNVMGDQIQTPENSEFDAAIATPYVPPQTPPKNYGPTTQKKSTPTPKSTATSSPNPAESPTPTPTATPNTSDITASCKAEPSTIKTGESTTWKATGSGGNGTFTYQWSGDFNDTTENVSKTYTESGSKDANVKITSGDKSASATCKVEVTPSEAPSPTPTATPE